MRILAVFVAVVPLTMHSAIIQTFCTYRGQGLCNWDWYIVWYLLEMQHYNLSCHSYTNPVSGVEHGGNDVRERHIGIDILSPHVSTIAIMDMGRALPGGISKCYNHANSSQLRNPDPGTPYSVSDSITYLFC